MIERMKNRQELGARSGVRETIAPKGGILKKMMMVAGLAVAGVLGLAGKGKADTFEDYVASFNDPGNLRLLGPEVNAPGSSNRVCSITPDNQLRWRRGAGGFVSILQMPININPDGTATMTPPATRIYGPSDTDVYSDNFLTNDYEFLENGGLYRYPLPIGDPTLLIQGSFTRYATTPYVEETNIAFSADSGRVRSGLTPDDGDIYRFPANFEDPPLPITTLDEFHAVATRIPELSPDPPDRAEALIQLRAIFGQRTEHAFVTEICGRGLGDCGPDSDQNTSDIFAYARNDVMGIWDVGSKTRVASTLDRYDEGSCVLDTDEAECLFVERVVSGRTNLFVTCHCKDPDDDGRNNCEGDNCPTDANPDQSNLDGDLRGDACDPCPGDATDDASDIDGVCDDIDNCLGVSNADQSDRDLDGAGDACDTCADDPRNDEDGDEICGDRDNCPDVPNPGQEDTYGDPTRGDACEPPPVMDAGMEGGVDGGRDAGTEGGDSGSDGGDSGVDSGTDGNIDGGRDAGVDAGTDVKSDAGMDVGDESTDAGVNGDSGNDVLDENSDANDGGRTEIKKPPRHKPGCGCSAHEKESPTSIIGKIGFLVGLATARILRRRKRVNAKR